jgi:hypothetical protein
MAVREVVCGGLSERLSEGFNKTGLGYIRQNVREKDVKTMCPIIKTNAKISKTKDERSNGGEDVASFIYCEL